MSIREMDGDVSISNVDGDISITDGWRCKC